MNILENMEAVFFVTLGLACSASYLLDTVPQAHASARTAFHAGDETTAAPMTVVVVSAKRMSAAEKQQSLREERRLASLRG